ncbi:MAG: hypothetical protein AAFY60_13730 [Myxococcota bacterium]
MASELDVDWSQARRELEAIYSELDGRLSGLTQNLDLPCHRGCSACCHESVFLTPLEFLFAWEYVQDTFSASDRDTVIQRGLSLYEEHRERILALEEAPVAEHDAIARELKFTCPLLGADGGCRIYPARELYARLFGCSFNDAGGVYGCHLVGAHLGGKIVTLPRVRSWGQKLGALPLTFKRQVYPFWIHWLFGAE